MILPFPPAAPEAGVHAVAARATPRTDIAEAAARTQWRMFGSSCRCGVRLLAVMIMILNLAGKLKWRGRPEVAADQGYQAGIGTGRGTRRCGSGWPNGASGYS